MNNLYFCFNIFYLVFGISEVSVKKAFKYKNRDGFNIDVFESKIDIFEIQLKTWFMFKALSLQ